MKKPPTFFRATLLLTGAIAGLVSSNLANAGTAAFREWQAASPYDNGGFLFKTIGYVGEVSCGDGIADGIENIDAHPLEYLNREQCAPVDSEDGHDRYYYGSYRFFGGESLHNGCTKSVYMWYYDKTPTAINYEWSGCANPPEMEIYYIEEIEQS